MKLLPACLMMLAAAALASGPAGAASHNKKGARASRPAKTPTAQAPSRQNGAFGRRGDYYQNIIDAQPFGSQRWWEVYGRQRGSPH